MVNYLTTVARLRSACLSTTSLLVVATIAAGCTQQPVRVVDGMQNGPRVIKPYNPMQPGPVEDNIPVTEVQARPGGLSGVAMPSQPTMASARITEESLSAIEPAAGPSPVATSSVRSSAPVQAPQPKVVQKQVEEVTHTTTQTDTIYKLARQYDTTAQQILADNGLKTDLPSQLANVKAPEAAKEQVVAQAIESGVVAKQEVVKAELETKAVKEQAQTESKMVTANVKPVTIDMAQLAEQKRGQIDQQAARAKGLVWPVKGEIVRKFGDDGNGVALTGINIAVPEGTPVLAAEGGKVLYADNGLKVYGNLVLVRHDNGMVSAYAHNGYLLVKKNESVRKGQVIALSGASGNVERPQLHFELRQHASAVDPLRVLPKLSSL